MRTGLVALLVALTAACGSSPTAPTAVAQAPPAATIALETWGFGACLPPLFVNTDSCRIEMTIRNQGPNCAGVIRGTLHIIDGIGGPTLQDVQFDFPSTLTLRPNETYAATSSAVVNVPKATDRRGRLEIFNTPTRC